MVGDKVRLAGIPGKIAKDTDGTYYVRIANPHYNHKNMCEFIEKTFEVTLSDDEKIFSAFRDELELIGFLNKVNNEIKSSSKLLRLFSSVKVGDDDGYVTEGRSGFYLSGLSVTYKRLFHELYDELFYEGTDGEFPECSTLVKLTALYRYYQMKSGIDFDSEPRDKVETITEKQEDTTMAIAKDSSKDLYTQEDEISELRKRLTKYEEILTKMFEGPLNEGVLLSKEHDHRFRISVNDNVTFTSFNPKTFDPSKVKIGDRVMCNKDGMILQFLPKELEEVKEAPKFNFVTWDQIGGLKSQIKKIHETIDFPIKHAKAFKTFGLKPSRGIALYGPAGCGKTMIAKAIASDILKGKELTEDSFIYLKGGEMLSPYVGQAENNIKRIFDRTRRYFKETGNRSVIFIDEAEAILPARGSRLSSDVETTIVPTFLSEMDGFEDNSTFIILATNFLEQLDEAVIRPGRIDLNLPITRPTLEDTTDILTIYLKKSKVKGSASDLAKEFAPILFKKFEESISGALIKNIVDKAAMLAIRQLEETGKADSLNIDYLTKALTY